MIELKKKFCVLHFPEGHKVPNWQLIDYISISHLSFRQRSFPTILYFYDMGVKERDLKTHEWFTRLM